MFGAQNQQPAAREAESHQKKKPENSERFRGVNQHIDRAGHVVLPSSIQTILSALELHQIMQILDCGSLLLQLRQQAD
jgi:hypothetical protein